MSHYNQKLSDISIQFIKGVGPARKKLFLNLGVETVEDLLCLFPRRYEDRRQLLPIAQLHVGEFQTICAKVQGFSERRSYYTKKHVTEVILDDGSGRLAVTWFNQPYLKSYFKKGKTVICYGKVDVYKNRLQMISPEYEVMDSAEDESLSLKRIVPIYPLTRGMTQRYLRKIIRASIEKYSEALEDQLPVTLRNKHRLANIRRSISNIHFPDTPEIQEEAMRRVSFEEFYFFQISVMLRRMFIKQKQGFSHELSDLQTLEFVNGFNFVLTAAQKRVIQEIREDMKKDRPMLRLVQGDVGCGKTIVAVFGCYNAFKNGHQSCVMAPTEILARQHYDNIQKMTDLGPLKGMRIGLLISSLKKAERDKILRQMTSGEIDLIIGTHALISDEVVFKDLSFAVIDEQHKFGVQQRALLGEKGTNPDVLIMTATPIPRTLCITLYGDLDLSIIDEMPPGRGTIKTVCCAHEQIDQVYHRVRQELDNGSQAYFVYPLIDESEQVDLKSAEETYKIFCKTVFKTKRIGLVHGRMKPQETDQIMMQFKNGELDVLVATTVLEVGIDVPNAGVMVIEHADRFGLAQLHQLRGRIGRGGKDGICVLVADPTTAEGQKRIHAIMKTTDGFKIAQEDLEIRGPGHFFGRHQHGLNELKVANPLSQLDILELARKEAEFLVKEDPHFLDPAHRHILDLIKNRYPTYLDMVLAG